MTTTVIRGGHLLTMDARLGEIDKADVLIEDGHITRIGADIFAPDGADSIDASRHMDSSTLTDICGRPSCVAR